MFFATWLLALGLTAKQCGLPILPAAWRAMRRQGLSFVLIVGLVATAVVAPFYLWDPQAFLSVVLLKHMNRPPDLTTLTLSALSHQVLHWTPPRPLLWGLAGLRIGWVTYHTSVKGVGSAGWMGTALLAFFMCHTQGYIHYFCLCEYLLLLGAISLVSEVPARRGGASSFPPRPADLAGD